MVEALAAAGAHRVLTVGGDRAGLRAAGLETVGDEHPGQGPLGGILTALRALDDDIVVVAACDLPGADPDALGAVVDALAAHPDAAVAAPLHDGRLELLHGAWRRAARGPLADAFALGERAVYRAVSSLAVIAVTDLPAAALADADRPEDLSGR